MNKDPVLNGRMAEHHDLGLRKARRAPNGVAVAAKSMADREKMRGANIWAQQSQGSDQRDCAGRAARGRQGMESPQGRGGHARGKGGRRRKYRRNRQGNAGGIGKTHAAQYGVRTDADGFAVIGPAIFGLACLRQGDCGKRLVLCAVTDRDDDRSRLRFDHGAGGYQRLQRKREHHDKCGEAAMVLKKRAQFPHDDGCLRTIRRLVTGPDQIAGAAIDI
jgi:hypothetical protein